MRKLLSIAAIFLLSVASAAGAQEVRPVSQEATSATPPGTMDQQKAQWFAHAIDDILSGETNDPGQQGVPHGRSAGQR